jgi:uncharacterized damage-inducible protein DinB
MSMIEAFVQELDQEAQTTRRVLERVPSDRLAWKPHEKSMSLGQLALHVATVPGGVSDALRQPRFVASRTDSRRRLARRSTAPAHSADADTPRAARDGDTSDSA